MPDLVGVVIPNYIGALSSLAGVVVAILALIAARQARADARTALAREESRRRSTVAARNSPAAAPSVIAASRRPSGPASAVLAVTELDGNVVLQNVSDALLTVEAIDVVTEPFDITVRRTLPYSLEPGEGLGFVAHHVLGGPAIAVIEVLSSTPGGSRRTRIFV